MNTTTRILANAWKIIPATALAALPLGTQVEAAQSSGKRSNQSHMQSSDSQSYRFDSRSGQWKQSQSQRNAQTKSLNGTIQGFHTLNLRDQRGQQSKQTLIKLKLQSGKTTVVNLGNLRNSNLDLRKGEQIRVQARLGSIDDQNVLVATRLQADNRTYQVRSDRRSSGGQISSTQSSQKQVSIRGQLEGYSRVQLKGQQDPHMVVRLRMQDGERAFVNLGPNTSLGDLSLNRGDKVVIKGNRGTIDGRSVLMARSIQIDGEMIKQRSGS